MSAKNHKSNISIEQPGFAQIQFLGEQDGIPERNLKQELVNFFLTYKTVQRAYLAQIRYNGWADGVALCLVFPIGNEMEIVMAIQKLFSKMFGSHEYLDIIFLDKAQEGELSKCCATFFSRQ